MSSETMKRLYNYLYWKWVMCRTPVLVTISAVAESACMDSVVILLDRDSHVIDVFATEQDVVEYFSKTEEVHIIDDDRVLVNGCVTYQFEHWDVKSFFGGDDYIPDPHDPDRLVHVDNL